MKKCEGEAAASASAQRGFQIGREYAPVECDESATGFADGNAYRRVLEEVHDFDGGPVGAIIRQSGGALDYREVDGADGGREGQCEEGGREHGG